MDAWLAHNFGVAETYNPAQVGRALHELKLKPRYHFLAYARFLSADDYAALADRLSLSMEYERARELMARYAPLQGRFEPLGMNAYVASGNPPDR